MLGQPSLRWILQKEEGFSLGSWEDLRACWQLAGINISCCFLALRQEDLVTARPQGRIKTISTQVGLAIVLLHYNSLSQLCRTQRWSSAFKTRLPPVLQPTFTPTLTTDHIQPRLYKTQSISAGSRVYYSSVGSARQLQREDVKGFDMESRGKS